MGLSRETSDRRGNRRGFFLDCDGGRHAKSRKAPKLSTEHASGRRGPKISRLNPEGSPPIGVRSRTETRMAKRDHFPGDRVNVARESVDGLRPSI